MAANARGRRHQGFTPRRRVFFTLAGVVAVLLAMLTFAVHDAKARILQALGPRATVGDIALSYPVVTLNDVRIGADPKPGAWPSAEEFRARRVEVRIQASDLWAYRRGVAPLRIADVHVQDGRLVVLRTTGHVTMLPALRETTQATAQAQDATATATAPTALVVEHVRLERLGVDLFDATLAGGAPHRLRFEDVHGGIEEIALPALDRSIRLDLVGAVASSAAGSTRDSTVGSATDSTAGIERSGRVAIKGNLNLAAHDADLALEATGVDMVPLEPWLLRVGDAEIRQGRLDLSLRAHVVDREVHAPGHLAFTGLEFGEPTRTFAGVERRAVLAALKRDGRIDLKFVIDGRTDDPAFSLDEKLGRRIVAGLGEAVGTGIKGVASGIGGAVKELFGAGGRER